MTRGTVFVLPAGAILAVVLCIAGCGSGPDPGPAESKGGGREARESGAEDWRRRFAERVAEVRSDLDEARRSVEALVKDGPEPSREAARRARERAERALSEGTELVRQAVRDRDARVLDWARHVQESMTRLERSLDDLTTRSGSEHAGS